MIDRRLLGSGTKDDFIARGWKTANELLNGDTIYGLAIGEISSSSKTILLGFGTLTYSCSSVSTSTSANASLKFPNYYALVFYLNESVCAHFTRGSSGLASTLQLKPLLASPSGYYVYRGIPLYISYIFDYIKVLNSSSSEQTTLDMVYRGGSYTLDDEVLFLTESPTNYLDQ